MRNWLTSPLEKKGIIRFYYLRPITVVFLLPGIIIACYSLQFDNPLQSGERRISVSSWFDAAGQTRSDLIYLKEMELGC